MNYHVLTLFPEMIEQGLHTSILGRAMETGALTLETVNIRDYADNRHHKVDDYPYGGGAGMVMQAEPVYRACLSVQERIGQRTGRRARVIYVTPQGSVFCQKTARELAREEDLIFLCGHYEGIDERVLEEVVTDYVSVGDYVLTGGELAAMVMIDAVSRLVPGVLNNEESAQFESFEDGLLEYPQYSRPKNWRGKQVPPVLLSGDHLRVEAWRREQSLLRTRKRRPDLYEAYERERNTQEKPGTSGKRKIGAVVFEWSACAGGTDSGEGEPKAAPYLEEILKLSGELGLWRGLAGDCPAVGKDGFLQILDKKGLFERILKEDTGERELGGNFYKQLLEEVHLPGKKVLAFVSSPEGIQKAREAGMRVVWLSPQGGPLEKSQICFRQIADFLEGMALLRNL